MAHKTLIRLGLAVLVIMGLVLLGHGQYNASVASRREAALRAEQFRARAAADARNADSEKGQPSAILPGKTTER
jgi:hypothetical protein